MQQKNIFFAFLIFTSLFSSVLMAQHQPKLDSIYQKIEEFSNKRKSTKLLYRLLFRDVPDTVSVPNNIQNFAIKKYENKHIRNVYITTIDPLGYNFDMNKSGTRWYEDLGNRLHMKTRNFTIRGYLLFKKGDEFNAQRLYESERLLRNMNFINRVHISPVDSTATKDSVDIAVKILDSWSLHPSANFSGKKLGLGITEDNFLGMGHELSLEYKTDFNTKQHSSLGRYTANNIYGTYINTQILGEKDFYNNENVYIRSSREFFSPFTRWAVGISLDYFKRNIQIPTGFNVNPKYFPTALVKVHNQNFWAGYQFRISSADNKVTDNLAVTARFQNYLYLESPSATIDPSNFYHSYNVLLGSVGYTQRKFKVVKNVFKYELPEDLPYGKSIAFIGGVMRDFNQSSYPYFGITAGLGTFTKFGYFNYKAQFGSFFKEKKNYRSTFRLDGLYFTPLQDWKFAQARHFFSPTFVSGNMRNPSYADGINISASDEFAVYNPNYLGKDKLVLRYQLQLFVKKTWKNFQVSPYFTTALGWLSNDEQKLFQSQVNTKFGVGILFYNPFLAFNRFQFSFVFYPKIPFDGNSIFDVNNYRNHQMPLHNFTIGEPSIVNYNQ